MSAFRSKAPAFCSATVATQRHQVEASRPAPQESGLMSGRGLVQPGATTRGPGRIPGVETLDAECASETSCVRQRGTYTPTHLWPTRTNPLRIRLRASVKDPRIQRSYCGRPVQYWHLSSASGHPVHSTTRTQNDHRRAVQWSAGLRTRLRGDNFCERKLWAFPRPRIDHGAQGKIWR
ncbi:hypothetical protein C8Q70DRAFT_284023 [Cubamyces menziesii]|nr:hypothetical protein C8Q70DRAFT_284023 [Cubamyces menziesii]